MWSVLFVSGSVLGLVGCGGEESRLSEELVAPISVLVAEQASSAGVDLGPADAECAARRLGDDEAVALTDAMAADLAVDADLATRLAAAILDCVDSDLLARSALAPFTSGVGEASVACTADELDDELLGAMIAANLRGVPMPSAQVELQVATALALCLEPDELLNRG